MPSHAHGPAHDLAARRANGGVTDLDALLAFEPQPESGGGFDVHLLGDALASRNVHAAIHDARRLCQVLSGVPALSRPPGW